MKKIISMLATLCMPLTLLAQDDLDKIMGELEKQDTKKEVVRAAFKSSRLVNLHTSERVAKGSLEFRISHRFGALKGGLYELFGLDNASTRFGLEYGLTDWLMVGIGRSNFQKTYDGFAKIALLQQSTGAKTMPLSINYLTNLSINTLQWDNTLNYQFAHRITYTHQLILSRKFSDAFSLLLAPTWVHRNLVETAIDKNDVFALGMGGRYKLSKRVAFNAEYVLRIDDNSPDFKTHYNALSVGFDIDTGGHVFQLHLTNSQPIFDAGYLTATTDTWSDGGIHFGFNITREFVLKR